LTALQLERRNNRRPYSISTGRKPIPHRLQRGERREELELAPENQDHFNVQLKDVSETVAMFAVQGPRARDILRALSGTDLENIERYSASEAKVNDIPVLITRTGYTGRSEEHTSELQSRENLVCRLLLEKKKI